MKVFVFLFIQGIMLLGFNIVWRAMDLGHLDIVNDATMLGVSVSLGFASFMLTRQLANRSFD